jgi:hypothetical protein
MAVYALIKGNVVANVIMADQEFAEVLKASGDYDHVVATGGAVIGNLYDSETGEFVDPDPNTPIIAAQREAERLAAEEAAAKELTK